jgi:anthranilate synthase component I
MATFLPSFDEFDNHLKAGKTQLVWTFVPADLETPLSAYLKTTRDGKHSFLLESVEGGAVLGRYSFIGFDPDIVWEYKKGSKPDPLTELRQMLADSTINIVDPSIPPMGPSGLFGYMGYDMVRLVENIPDTNPDLVNIPDSIMMRPTAMVIFDNVQSKMCLVTPVRETSGDAKAIYDAAIRRLQNILERLADPIPSTALHFDTKLQTPLPVTEGTDNKEFKKMVARAMEYIRAGDIFQVVLSIPFSMPFDLPGLSLYRSLRRTNPSPFLFYMNYGGFQLVGSSPEILVRVRDGRVTIRPIAGTRKRGRNAAEDKALADELLADPKERAEHLMLLDLGRNDVGRVAKSGTVTVTDQFFIERYSHVMHIVSNVEGELREDLDMLDALFAGFPAGTVSGAPKVRAMEIIDELEDTKRGYYGGCIGYLSGNGDMDTCIALRTALVKDGMIHVRAGAGIVADSDPDSEYQECVNKSRAVVTAAAEAIDLAQAMRRQNQ